MSGYDHEKQMLLNRRHALNPEVGDYWHEMFMPVVFVVMVDAERVCIQRDFKGQSFTPGVDPKPHVMTRRAFRKWLHYDSIPDKTWCSVVPDWLGKKEVA